MDAAQLPASHELGRTGIQGDIIYAKPAEGVAGGIKNDYAKLGIGVCLPWRDGDGIWHDDDARGARGEGGGLLRAQFGDQLLARHWNRFESVRDGRLPVTRGEGEKQDRQRRDQKLGPEHIDT